MLFPYPTPLYGPWNSFGSDVDCTLHHSPWAGRNVVSEDKAKIWNVNARRSKNMRWRRARWDGEEAL